MAAALALTPSGAGKLTGILGDGGLLGGIEIRRLEGIICGGIGGSGVPKSGVRGVTIIGGLGVID